jgi:hypothetical protein
VLVLLCIYIASTVLVVSFLTPRWDIHSRFNRAGSHSRINLAGLLCINFFTLHQPCWLLSPLGHFHLRFNRAGASPFVMLASAYIELFSFQTTLAYSENVDFVCIGE